MTNPVPPELLPEVRQLALIILLYARGYGVVRYVDTGRETFATIANRRRGLLTDWTVAYLITKGWLTKPDAHHGTVLTATGAHQVEEWAGETLGWPVTAQATDCVDENG